MESDWRLGLAATPKMRDHKYFGYVGIIRNAAADTLTIEMLVSWDGQYAQRSPNPTILMEPADGWMTA